MFSKALMKSYHIQVCTDISFQVRLIFSTFIYTVFSLVYMTHCIDYTDHDILQVLKTVLNIVSYMLYGQGSASGLMEDVQEVIYMRECV